MRLGSKFDMQIPGLEKLRIERSNSKQIIIPEGCTYFKADLYPSTMNIPHWVDTLRIEYLQNVW